MKIIGLTGGIGSGKTTIAKVFSSLGIPVFNSDTTAKKLYEDLEIINTITAILGNKVLDENGRINKIKMAEIIFNDSEKLNSINRFIHPKVKNKFDEFCEVNRNTNYIIKEAAILFESGSYKNLDGVICVVSPLELRVKRVLIRDQQTEAEILKRISNQWSDEQRVARSNWVINNEENNTLLDQVLFVHQKISET